MMMTVCPTCGRPLDEHNRHLRFGVPEPVLSVPKEERAARTWGNDVLMQVQGIGSFVRILIPALHKKSDTTCFSSVETQICARVRPEPYEVIPPASAAWSFNFSLKPR